MSTSITNVPIQRAWRWITSNHIKDETKLAWEKKEEIVHTRE